MRKPYVVGVAGASGSGKTTLAEGLLQHWRCLYPDRDVASISLDAYYRDLTHLSFEERDQLNFDHPDAIEFELLNEQLHELDRHRTVTIPVYDFTRHTRGRGGEVLQPPDILILEGLLIGANDELLARINHLVFVETDLAVCLERRLSRDVAERGRSEASVRDFWAQRVTPMYLQFGAPLAAKAHTRVSGEQPIGATVNEVTEAVGLVF